jgi:glycosyltransferase involved in cell wall biosynthesis
MSALRISVIVPTLNEAAHVAATVASIRASLPAAEIIVADGGSTDDTPHLADRIGVQVVTGATGRGSHNSRREPLTPVANYWFSCTPTLGSPPTPPPSWTAPSPARKSRSARFG